MVDEFGGDAEMGCVFECHVHTGFFDLRLSTCIHHYTCVSTTLDLKGIVFETLVRPMGLLV